MNNSKLFCVDGFWSDILFQNKNDPLFTHCFQFSLILMTSLSFLMMIMILFLIKYIWKDENKIKMINDNSFDFYRMVEFILPIFSAIFSIIDLMNEYYYSDTKDILLFLSFILFSLSLIIMAFCIKTKHSGKSLINYIMFIFWWLSNGAYVVRFYDNVFKVLKKSNTFEIFILTNSAFLMFTLLSSLIFICFQGFSSNSEKYETPEEESSILSDVTYSWMDKYMFQWFKGEMTNETTFDLASEFESKLNTKNVTEIFSKKCSEIQRENDQKILSEGSSNDYRSNNSGMILFKSLWQINYHRYIILNSMRIVRIFIYLTLPFILRYLLQYFNLKENQDTWKGILLAFVFLVQSLVSSILDNYVYLLSNKIALRVRAALLGMIYKKIFKISIDARKDNDVGNIVNMCSMDIEQISQCIYFNSSLLSCPIELILVAGFMYSQIEFAIFGGVVFEICIIAFVFAISFVIKLFIKKEISLKDERMNLMAEILKGIKIIKMYSWEEIFNLKSLYIRNEELKNLVTFSIGRVSILSIFSLFIQLALYFNLLTYIYFYPMSTLSVEKIFVMYAFIGCLLTTVSILPLQISNTINAVVSFKRIEKYLLSSEMNIKLIDYMDDKISPSEAININNGFFGWNEKDKEILKNINLVIEKGALVAIVGKVGVGKSTLLSSIIRETCSLGGTIKTQGSFAIVSQEAWIQNMSLRDNILFTKEYNESFYNTVTKACCLDYDIGLLPMKDQSEIGEGGINLSGGQRQRISLARAIYQNSDIYLLDDPLSAVDVKVGEQLFNDVIGKDGLLKDKTRILVTNGIKWLSFMDEIIFINSEGKISEKGTFKELETFIKEYYSKRDYRDMDIVNDGNFANINNEMASKDLVMEFDGKAFNNNKINEEHIMAGEMSWKVLFWYFKKNGVGIIILSLILCITIVCLEAYGNVWLSTISKYHKYTNKTKDENDKIFYRNFVNYFGLIILTQLVLLVFLSGIIIVGVLRASKKIYEVLLQKILNSNLSFFDFNPSGRILNRFGKDLYNIDHLLLTNIFYIPRLFFLLLSIFIMIVAITPWFGLVLIPILIAFFIFQSLYVTISRQSRCLDLRSHSFILTNVVETYKGSSIIKSFRAEKDFKNKQYSNIDYSNKFTFIYYLSTHWFSLRLDILCNLIVFAAIIFAVINRHNLDTGLVGLSITNALRVLGLLNFLLKMLSEFKVNSVSIERILQYTKIQTESDRDNKKKFPQDWIPRGNISFEQFSLKYHKENSCALNDISLNILSGEKIGIVGRTGAGKSTIALALLRFIEGCNGEIFIDGINIKSVGLEELRKQITVLPQDPVIFSGTLRHNIDPFDEYSTEKIIESLEICGLMEWVTALKENIDFFCESMGTNLSVGQKQLLCLARTILKKTKIIVIDEATAFVDEKTGQKVMDAVKSQFIDSTVIIIAHRISSIIDCDKILVLNKGQILEYGSPKELLSNVNGIFKSMIMCISAKANIENL